MTKPEGVLVVNVIEAKNLPKQDLISKNDPFVELWTENAPHQSTRVISNTNNPFWNSTFTFPIEQDSLCNLLHFKVYDKDLVGKDLIGEASIAFEQAADATPMDMWIGLKNKKNDKVRGELHVGIEFRTM